MEPEAKEPKASALKELIRRFPEPRHSWMVPIAAVAAGALAGVVWLTLSTWAPTPLPEPKAPSPPAVEAPEPTGPAGPRVAIVIDDLGRSLRDAKVLIALPQPLTLAVLPKLAYSRRVAEVAGEAGREVLLHLPMEPLDYPAKNPGPGALLSSMSPGKLLEVLGEDLDSLPNPVGVNNHMGSRLTEDEEVMRVVLGALKERGLFFLDSYTTPNSVVQKVARELGLPSASRQVFLDHVPDDPDYVASQIDKLAQAAKKHGEAIGIGHPHPATIAALKEGLPRLARQGITIVPLSRLVERPSQGSNSAGVDK